MSLEKIIKAGKQVMAEENQHLEFDPEAYGTPNPEWTKRKVTDFNRLAIHIVTRTPPKSFETKMDIWMSVLLRNQPALKNWSKGYDILTEKVFELLVQRGDFK